MKRQNEVWHEHEAEIKTAIACSNKRSRVSLWKFGEGATSNHHFPLSTRIIGEIKVVVRNQKKNDKKGKERRKK